jgi:hypothetical protein
MMPSWSDARKLELRGDLDLAYVPLADARCMLPGEDTSLSPWVLDDLAA